MPLRYLFYSLDYLTHHTWYEKDPERGQCLGTTDPVFFPQLLFINEINNNNNGINNSS